MSGDALLQAGVLSIVRPLFLSSSCAGGILADLSMVKSVTLRLREGELSPLLSSLLPHRSALPLTTQETGDSSLSSSPL